MMKLDGVYTGGIPIGTCGRPKDPENEATRLKLIRANGKESSPRDSFSQIRLPTGSTTPVERAVVKSTGQVRFVPLASDPAGAEAGDVYYNSTSNKLKCYNGTTWNDLF